MCGENMNISMNILELAKFQGEKAERAIRAKYLDAISNNNWRELSQIFLTMEKPRSQYAYPIIGQWTFSSAPGSGAHHTHFGGLALHTLQNLEYADSWAGLYEGRGIEVDRDLLYATIIIHDSMKRFIYCFDNEFNFKKSEDAFIAKREDHHSWVLRELCSRGCDKELLLSVAAIHGIDDVSLADGVKSVAIVNHYLTIGDTGLAYTPDDIRAEHVIAFLSDSDWHWSGQAQRKTGLLAERIEQAASIPAKQVKLYLGSRYSYEKVGKFIEQHGYDGAADYYLELLGD